MKLHVGCGAVYLRDWVNIDLPLPHVFLTRNRPDLISAFETLESDYYGRHRDKTADRLRAGAVKQATVCDVYGSFTFLPVRPQSANEVLSRQVFEHLDRTQAREALRECHRALAPGGLLRIDIPDPDETLRRFGETQDEFFIRHLFGPRLNEFGFHTHYTRGLLKDLVESHGFKFLQEEPNIHFYPAFCLRFNRE